MVAEHADMLGQFYPAVDGDLQVNSAGGGETGAPQVHVNRVPREWYHTDWVAEHHWCVPLYYRPESREEAVQ